MDEKIIHNYLQGKTSEEEEKALWEWINLSDDNKNIFFELKAIWNANQTVFSDKKRFTTSLKELNTKIEAYNSQKRDKKTMLYICRGVAAAAIFAVIFYFSFTQYGGRESEMIVYTNNSDTIRNITLTDGSKIWLRNNSTLTYIPSRKNTREVSLVGEAFFDVAKHADPFIVTADVNLIEVKGTSFSINTNRNGFIETILMSGSVQIQPIGANSVTILHPGQQALYSKENKSLEINDIDPNIHTSWRYELTSLSHVSIQTILQCIEETYDVRLKMDTLSLRGHYYNFSFKHSKSIENALHQLSLITGVPVEIINKKIK